MDSILNEVPDVILMDIYLGPLDGRDLCYALKMSDNYHNLPIILYSASSNILKSSIEKSLANDFIAKPFDIVTLIEKIRLQAHNGRNSLM